MAEDIRTTSTDQNAQNLNFDIFTNPQKLLPYTDSVAETTSTATMAGIGISDINYPKVLWTQLEAFFSSQGIKYQIPFDLDKE
jgi:hypothetical protein